MKGFWKVDVVVVESKDVRGGIPDIFCWFALVKKGSETLIFEI